jgi:hypothetical protein
MHQVRGGGCFCVVTILSAVGSFLALPDAAWDCSCVQSRCSDAAASDAVFEATATLPGRLAAAFDPVDPRVPLLITMPRQ